jgi:hypothetical protein
VCPPRPRLKWWIETAPARSVQLADQPAECTSATRTDGAARRPLLALGVQEPPRPTGAHRQPPAAAHRARRRDRGIPGIGPALRLGVPGARLPAGGRPAQEVGASSSRAASRGTPGGSSQLALGAPHRLVGAGEEAQAWEEALELLPKLCVASGEPRRACATRARPG